jgi:hypothetical protein
LAVVVDGGGGTDAVASECAKVEHDAFLPEEGVSVAGRRLGFADDLSPGVDAERGAAFSAEGAEFDYRSVRAVCTSRGGDARNNHEHQGQRQAGFHDQFLVLRNLDATT